MKPLREYITEASAFKIDYGLFSARDKNVLVDIKQYYSEYTGDDAAQFKMFFNKLYRAIISGRPVNNYVQVLIVNKSKILFAGQSVYIYNSNGIKPDELLKIIKPKFKDVAAVASNAVRALIKDKDVQKKLMLNDGNMKMPSGAGLV